MSILNVLLSPERALVAVDTRMLNGKTGAHYYSSKMFPIVHANILIACRGDRLFGEMAFSWHLASEACDFDSIAHGLPEALNVLSERYASMPGEYVGGIELVIVGWSEKDRAMRCVVCTRPDKDGPFTITRMDNGVLAPALTEDLRHLTVANHVEYLTVVARSQVRQIRNEQPDYPIGGRLILADMTRDRMEIREIANLEDA